MSIAITDRPGGTRAIGDIHVHDRPFAAPGLGFTWLKFPMTLQLAPLDKPPAYLTAFLADITATFPGQTPVGLGRAQPNTSLAFSTYAQPQRQTFEMWLHLSGEQIEALERRREGQRLEFHINLTVQIHYAGIIHTGRGDARFQVSESDWAEILRQIGYLDRLIVAVDLPLNAPELIRTAVRHIRAAHEHLIAGRYTDAVGVCRKAVESLHPFADDVKAQALRDAFAKSRDAREKMTVSERAELVRLAVQHFANPAHHDEPGKPAEVYSRQDASFVLSATAGVIWKALGRHAAPPAAPSASKGASPP